MSENCFSSDASKTHNVAWDTSPVKIRHWVLESSPDVSVSLVSEDFNSDLRLVNREEKKQLGGVYVTFNYYNNFILPLPT